MSVGSSWISQMDVGMIETANYLGNHQYQQNDTDDRSLPADHIPPAKSWLVALVLSLVFHACLMKVTEGLPITIVTPELSSSQSISIRFATISLEQPVVEEIPKIEDVPVVLDSVTPIKVTKAKPVMAMQKKPKVVKNKASTPEKITAVKTTTPTLIKEVVQLTRPASTDISNNKPARLIYPKKPIRSNKKAKPETISESVETLESFPLIKNLKFLKPPTKPKYPRLARRKKQQGTSIILAKISKLGTVDEIRLQKTSGYHLLDKSAMNALRRWQFQPATQAGVTVTAWVQVPVKFQLKN